MFCWCVQYYAFLVAQSSNLLSAVLQHEFNDGLSVDPFEVIFIKVSHVVPFELLISEKDHLRPGPQGRSYWQQRLRCWLLSRLLAHLL